MSRGWHQRGDIGNSVSAALLESLLGALDTCGLATVMCEDGSLTPRRPPLILQPTTGRPRRAGPRDEKNGPSIELLPLQSAASGHVDHFVVNRRHPFFRVNGVDVDISMLAGPLPNFCVIEVDDTVALWWRNAAAFDYTPEIPVSRCFKSGERKGLYTAHLIVRLVHSSYC